MKLLITGVTGQLGHDVALEACKRGYEVLGSGSRESWAGTDELESLGLPAYISLDICDREAVREAVLAARPDCVIHCAAWTAVDAAEDQENREKVRRVNAGGTGNIALACREAGCKLVYVSTDYVFNGQGTTPWQPEDGPEPLNWYGQTKLEGERAVAEQMEKFFIVRTAWVYGLNGGNFVKTMIRLGKTHRQVRVVDDQISTPTYTADLARLLVDMSLGESYGYYHATNEGGYISWYEFCCQIYRQYGLDTQVIPVSTREYGESKAARPRNSRLDKSKLSRAGFEPLPGWQDALARYLQRAQL